MAPHFAHVHLVYMGKKPKPPRHFIRAWRKTVPGMTLERLADRIGSTHATLSRIENGKQPYSEDLLERLADAIGTTPGNLINRDPASPNPISDLWEQIAEQDRPKVAQILEAFRRKPGS